VPIIQLGLQSDTMSEQELFDMGQNFIRTQLATIQRRGAAAWRQVPQVMVDLNRPAHGQGLGVRRLFRPWQPESHLPGRQRQDRRQGFHDPTNSSPRAVEELNMMCLCG
jgi:hypothetical protein